MKRKWIKIDPTSHTHAHAHHEKLDVEKHAYLLGHLSYVKYFKMPELNPPDKIRSSNLTMLLWWRETNNEWPEWVLRIVWCGFAMFMSLSDWLVGWLVGFGDRVIWNSSEQEVLVSMLFWLVIYIVYYAHWFYDHYGLYASNEHRTCFRTRQSIIDRI